MQVQNNKRWVLVHKSTGKKRRALVTRRAARLHKRSTERIFDSRNGVYVR